ncbi:MAG: hypothetical protein RKE49_08325 [Oceanicaulis sp.]
MRSRPARLTRASIAGGVYFAAVFAAGFVLGTVRVLVLEPAIGALGAVLIEAPVILTWSWLVCRALIARMTPAPKVGERALMGAFAFTCLIAAELLLSLTVFGGAARDVVEGWITPAGALGLAGQIAFALFPLVMPRGDSAAS